jgi:phosphoribosyl-AMP cyclohydrolase
MGAKGKRADQGMKNINFNPQGLIPAIAQHATDGTVLMMAWMNEEALKLTLEKSEMVFWSRRRGELWHKGATSGNFLKVVSWSPDCDFDCLLFKVLPQGKGVACHTGEKSCFFQWENAPFSKK